MTARKCLFCHFPRRDCFFNAPDKFGRDELSEAGCAPGGMPTSSAVPLLLAAVVVVVRSRRPDPLRLCKVAIVECFFWCWRIVFGYWNFYFLDLVGGTGRDEWLNGVL